MTPEERAARRAFTRGMREAPPDYEAIARGSKVLLGRVAEKLLAGRPLDELAAELGVQPAELGTMLLRGTMRHEGREKA